MRAVTYIGRPYKTGVLKHTAITDSMITANPHTQQVLDNIRTAYSDPQLGEGVWIARAYLGLEALRGTVHETYRIYSKGRPATFSLDNRDLFLRLAIPQTKPWAVKPCPTASNGNSTGHTSSRTRVWSPIYS